MNSNLKILDGFINLDGFKIFGLEFPMSILFK